MTVRANLIKPASKVEPLIDENNELISTKNPHNSKFLVRYSIFTMEF